MSLFSGMKITSGAEPDKNASSGKKANIGSSEERTTPAFGFISEAKDDSPIFSETPGRDSSRQANIQFKNVRQDSAKQTDSKKEVDTKHMSLGHESKLDLDLNLDLDLDVDIELDPFRTSTCGPDDLAKRILDTDLEGIDFTSDLDLNPSRSDAKCDDPGKNLKKHSTEQQVDEVVLKLDTDDASSQFSEFKDNALSDQNKRTTTSKFGFISESLHRVPSNTDNTDTDNIAAKEISCGIQITSIKQDNLTKSSKHFTDRTTLKHETVLVQEGDTNVAFGRTYEDTEEIEREKCDSGMRTEMREAEAEFVGSSSLYDLELDVSDMLEVLQEAHSAADAQFRELQGSLVSHLKELGREHLMSMFGFIQKQKRLNELQVLQTKAISEENYEQAEILMNECTSLENDLSSIPSLNLCDEDVFQDVFRKSRDAETSHQEQRGQWVKSYEDLLHQQEAVISRATEKRINDDWDERRQKLEKRKTELDRNLGHVQLDKDHVMKRESQLEARIAKKTSHLRETIEILLSERSVIQNDIAAVEERLAKLRLEEASLNDAISSQDSAIREVTVGFKEEISSLDEERRKVEAEEERLKEEQRGLHQQDEELAEENTHFQSRITSEENLLARISKALESITSPLKVFKEERVEAGFSVNVHPSKDLLCLREKIQDSTNEIQTTSSLILSKQAKLANCKKMVMETEDHIATLQGAKQLAVTTKNFGEAKRLAEEVKVKMAEGRTFQDEVETLSEELKQDKNKVEDLQEQIEKMKVELAETERTWELGLLESARDMFTNVTTSLDDQEREDSNKASSLACQMLEIEQHNTALVIGWLSERHGIPTPSDVDKLLLEFESQLVSHHKTKQETSDNLSSEVRAELAVLEKRLQEAVEEEDYDAAQHIQARIDHLHQC